MVRIFCICEVGTIGTYACGRHGSRLRFSSDADCSLKQEVRFVRMDKSNLNGFEARPPLGGRVVHQITGTQLYVFRSKTHT